MFNNCSFLKNEQEIRETLNKTYHWIENRCTNGEFKKENTGQNVFDLYSGSSGVMVYLLQLYQFTQNVKPLQFAKKIADNLINNYDSKIKKDFDNSFFHKGNAGLAFSFTELVKRTGEEKYIQFAQKLNSEIISSYGTKEMKIPILRWGSAGTGLYLIYLIKNGGIAVKESKEEIMANLTKGAKMMMDYGVPVHGDREKLRWYYKGKSGFELPGYADGTFGVVYYLLELYKLSNNTQFLECAKKGLNYMETILDITESNALYVYHSNWMLPVDAKYYLGECNGNTGSVKVFLKVYEITKQSKWLDYAIKSGNGLLENYEEGVWWIPKKEKKYYKWDTLNLCDGTAGGIESLFLLNQFNPSPQYQKAIDFMIEYIYSKRIEENNEVCWSQCESRTSQTHTRQVGMYQGAAGLSMTLMNMLNDNFRIKLPDYIF